MLDSMMGLVPAPALAVDLASESAAEDVEGLP
jgi:hypothetical protein